MTTSQTSAAFSFSITGTTAADILQMPGSKERVLVSDKVSAWSDAVRSRLEELIRLPSGWDGYQAVHASFENANFALRVLESVCEFDTPAPQIVPGALGDLQIEWHSLKGDIELHVRAPNDVHAWYALVDGDPDGEELDLTNDFVTVAQWVKEITEPSVDVAAAAAR